MSQHFGDNEYNRYGSAAFSDEYDLARAGMFKQTRNSLFVGFYDNRPIFYHGQGGVLLCAGARGGKLTTSLAFNLCAGICRGPIVALDMKGELAAISQNQTSDNKFNIYWNAARLHGLPQHRINPVDYININNPALVSEVKTFVQNMVPLSGSANADYFERRAQEFLEGIILTLVRMKHVLTLPDIYHAINLIPGNSDEWIDFAFEMSESGFPVSKRVEEEIAASRESSSNGFQGILGEMFKAFSCLSDPVLLESVSPPYDFSFADLCGKQAYQVYLMPPAEYIDAWSPVIKAMFVAGMIYKARKPQAPRQTWFIDECAALKGFPLIIKLYSLGAGMGILPVTVWQSLFQMRALGPDAENIISSSSSLQIYFAIRDLTTARTISSMIGAESLVYDDEIRQERARHAKRQAMQSILNGGDVFSAGLDYAHHKQAAEMQVKQKRMLREPDEVLNMANDKAFIFTDDLPKPLYADRKPYYEQRFMAGRYHPNPYHPPLDQVLVKTWFGKKWRDVITEPVPERYAHYPQYKNGTWSRIDGGWAW